MKLETEKQLNRMIIELIDVWVSHDLIALAFQCVNTLQLLYLTVPVLEKVLIWKISGLGRRVSCPIAVRRVWVDLVNKYQAESNNNARALVNNTGGRTWPRLPKTKCAHFFSCIHIMVRVGRYTDCPGFDLNCRSSRSHTRARNLYSFPGRTAGIY